MMATLLQSLAGDPEIERLLGDDEQLAAMLRFETALAAAEAQAGLISGAAATAIGAAISRFVPNWEDLAAGMARDGVVVPALLGQLRGSIGEPHAGDLHRGATSQDAVDTALMLQLAKVVAILIGRIDRVVTAHAMLDQRYGKQPLMAYTRMQAALRFTVADKIRTWCEPLARHKLALSEMQRDLLVIQLGGPVGDRSSFEGRGDAVATLLAASLGLGIAPSWHSSRESVVTFGGRLASLAGSLGKFGADVALLMQSEVGAVAISGAGRSSVMGHKTNPVGAELLVALAHQTAGLAGTLNHAMVHENERSGAAWTLEWLTLPPLVVATGSGLLAAERLLKDLTFTALP